MTPELITEKEFNKVRDFFHLSSGIKLADSKKSLVCGRLGSRLQTLKLRSFSDYIMYINQSDNKLEKQIAIDLLTTNETYFYREPKHFEFLTSVLADWKSEKLPVIWSAACSSGEEPYTIAMLMAEQFDMRPWSILASDLSTRMLNTARTALYPHSRVNKLPKNLIKKYLLKGKEKYDGYSLVDDKLKSRVRFEQRNLIEPQFLQVRPDIVFLRNVLIYFDVENKKKIVEQIARILAPGGLLFVGHSESLHGVTDMYQSIKPAVYQNRSQR